METDWWKTLDAVLLSMTHHAAATDDNSEVMGERNKEGLVVLYHTVDSRGSGGVPALVPGEGPVEVQVKRSDGEVMLHTTLKNNSNNDDDDSDNDMAAIPSSQCLG